MKRKFKRLLSVILCVAVTVSAAISGTAVFAAGIEEPKAMPEEAEQPKTPT